MRSKIFKVLLVAMFLFSATSAYAASDDISGDMGRKFVRGVVNTVTGWVEFPVQIAKGYKNGFRGNEDNKVVGTIVGFFSGLSHAAGRTVSGVSDIVGFWAAGPESVEGVGFPLDAEYAWEEGEKYSAFEPDFKEGAVIPVGKQLVRGFSDVLLGIAELPGQISKGASEGDLGGGILKGVWYWWSREVNGFTNIFTALVPHPKDTIGVTLDEEHAWGALVGDNLE